MAAASAPGGPYVQPGIMNEIFVEFIVGEAMLKIGMAGAVFLLGASVIGESVDAIAQKLTAYFGKHQDKGATVLALEGTSVIESIEGTFDINEEDSPKPKKTLEFDDEDIAAKSVPYKIAEVEARIKNTEDKKKKESANGLLEAQKEENMLMMVAQQENFKKERREMEKKFQEALQSNLETETRLRQKETQIDELLQQLTNRLATDQQTNQQTTEQQTQHKQTDPWQGKSPGPEVLQNKTGPPSKQIPTTTRMGTPDVDWNDLLQDIIQEWIGTIVKINKKAPEEHVVQHRLLHNFRELVEQAMQGQTIDKGRFKYLTRGNKGHVYDTLITKITRPIYSPTTISSGDYSPADADAGINNVTFGAGGMDIVTETIPQTETDSQHLLITTITTIARRIGSFS